MLGFNIVKIELLSAVKEYDALVVQIFEMVMQHLIEAQDTVGKNAEFVVGFSVKEKETFVVSGEVGFECSGMVHRYLF